MRRALFLHIHKTAGTSVQEMARKAYGNEQVISHADFEHLGVKECQSYEFVSGHFGFAFARQLMAGRYCFTFLRDPIDRLLSLYNFCLTRDPAENSLYSFAQNKTLEGFLRDCHETQHFPMVWNSQVWQLAYGRGHTLAGSREINLKDVDRLSLLADANANLTQFDHVGFVHTFNQDIQTIFRDLGAPNVVSKWSNATKGERRATEETPVIRALLDEMTELDRALYDLAVQTYQAPAIRKS